MNPSYPARPAPLELECLRVLWRAGSASVAEVRAGLPRPLAYTTVMTVLDRMAAKGLVARRKRGRAYLYSAALHLDHARVEALQNLLHQFFDDDRQALLRYLTGGAPARPPAAARPAGAAGPRRGAKPARRVSQPEPAFRPSHIDDSLL